MRVVVVGRFDGVHVGHRHLLQEARRIAANKGCPLLAYTFPPRPPALLPLVLKVRLLQELADEVEVVPWEGVRDLGAEEFLRREIRGRLKGSTLVMGPSHRFGRGREANPQRARELGEKLGLDVHVVEPFMVDGEIASARRIRELLVQGEVTHAARLLGRPPVLLGWPVRGLGLASKLGFPTLNLELDSVILGPRNGVYLAWAFWPEGGSPGLFYRGRRPTFPGLPPSTEIHLFSPPPSPLAHQVEVHLLAFIRPDQALPSPEALASQIAEDVHHAEDLLRKMNPPKPLLWI